ncbi:MULTISPECIES: lysozyme inhibitor LprI family protein [unclassified Serratia (in: enterobacteria)]|uniref:lysozyme inhibitor LprI family protein n=1 Tax=unclassified Serratia (in: enterobacteria) TaxID=2647522 RepID=UPI002ED26462|nr:lysozyme inhibitor LprI family protein [Serratia sp. C2(2)]MEE4445936.1 lysozyme inhibitor LprI family protein [Serratia sp. C2(1)]
MRMCIVALPLIFSAFFSTSVLAADKSESNCLQTAQSQAELNDCAAQTYKNADGEMNKAYKKVMDTLKSSPEKSKALLQAQRAWLKFRDADCAFLSSNSAGGSINAMNNALCLSERTTERTNSLNKIKKCDIGDPECQ